MTLTLGKRGGIMTYRPASESEAKPLSVDERGRPLCDFTNTSQHTRCVDRASWRFDIIHPCTCMKVLHSCEVHVAALAFMREQKLSFSCPFCGHAPSLLGESHPIT